MAFRREDNAHTLRGGRDRRALLRPYSTLGADAARRVAGCVGVDRAVFHIKEDQCRGMRRMTQ